MMTKCCRCITLVVLTGMLQVASVAQEPTRFISWNNGTILAGPGDAYQGKFGGRVMFDIAGFDQKEALENAYGKLDNSFEWRRIRAFHSGRLNNFKYKFQVELSKEYLFIEDMYVEAGDVPVVGNVRVGHLKEPFLFEAQTSSKYVLFMERAVTTMFSSGRNLGIMLHNRIAETDYYWSVGAFRNGLFDVVGESEHFGYNFTGRFSGLLARNVERTKFIHAGIGIKNSTFDMSRLSISSRPEAHMAHKYLSLGTVEDVAGMTAFSTEVILQSGRAALQTEMVHSFVHPEKEVEGQSGYYFAAVTAQVSYFLTRDTRNYKNGNSGYGKIRPQNELFQGGIGALEVAMRYSYADLNSGGIQGQSLRNISLGLNWYPNSIARISGNYIRSYMPGMGSSRIVQMRIQFAI